MGLAYIARHSNGSDLMRHTLADYAAWRSVSPPSSSSNCTACATRARNCRTLGSGSIVAGFATDVGAEACLRTSALQLVAVFRATGTSTLRAAGTSTLRAAGTTTNRASNALAMPPACCQSPAFCSGLHEPAGAADPGKQGGKVWFDATVFTRFCCFGQRKGELRRRTFLLNG